MNDKEIVSLKKNADYIRYLALECIERANSGHPGLPLGCAELGLLLYRDILNFNPDDPTWLNRDRFILSAGHGSMLLYSLLHTVGYNITLEDMANFRQLGSKTAGHPEYDLHDGIETTTGPLGQGFANAVGCAIEAKMMAQRFNTGDIDLIDYTVYTLMGDGCNMEGISYEAGSLAGHLGLDNLIAIYDSNDISIDGRMNLTFTEDVGKRYEALGWIVEHTDIVDPGDVFTKLQGLKEKKGKPKLLIVKTVIGQGVNKKKDTAGIHGAPAGLEEIVYFMQHSKIRELFEDRFGKEAVADNEKLAGIIQSGIAGKEPLLVYPPCIEFMKAGVDEGKKNYGEWVEKYETYQKTYPDKYETLSHYLDFKVPVSLRDKLLNYNEGKRAATRNVSGQVLNICAEELPQIVGGCADLAGSTKAGVKSSSYINRDDFSGRNIAFGVREHAMGAIGNGLALSRSMVPFTSTFFTFFDYMKPAVRLAALMKLKHLFIFSHDSIYLGEDGPTHQSIEHLNAMRLVPGIHAFRPANDIETAFSYLYFLEHEGGPVAIMTTRQKLSEGVFKLPRGRGKDSKKMYENFSKGAYLFYETDISSEPDIVLAASGSELSLALEAVKWVEEKMAWSVWLVSIPCLELLNEAGNEYKKELFPPDVPLVLIEAASHRGVDIFYREKFLLVDIQEFGLSAPGGDLAKHFGFTAEAIYERIAQEFH
ncbi:MAG: transketolase [bacterium]|nr:transketolase [bacterium]